MVPQFEFIDADLVLVAMTRSAPAPTGRRIVADIMVAVSVEGQPHVEAIEEK